MSKKKPSRSSKPRASSKRRDCTIPLERDALIAHIHAEFPTEKIDVATDVWSDIWHLVNLVYPDQEALWSEHCAVMGEVNKKTGHQVFNRLEVAIMDLEHRLVQAAFSAGFVSGQRSISRLAAERANVTDRFDDACDEATNAIAVLSGLADAKASQDAKAEYSFWSGVHDLATRIGVRLETLRECETNEANALYSIQQAGTPEDPRQPTANTIGGVK